MKISELNVAGALSGSEVFPIVQSGETKKVSITDALASAGGLMTADNGLGYDGSNVYLGGVLNQNTTIDGDGSKNIQIFNIDFLSIKQVNNTGIIIGESISIGDWDYNINGTRLNIIDTFKLINTNYNGFNVGLNLDFNSNEYSLGDILGNLGASSGISINSSLIQIYNTDNIAITGNNLITINSNSVVSRSANQLETGINLDFANLIFSFGHVNYGTNYLEFDSEIATFKAGSEIYLYAGNKCGLYSNIAVSYIGDITGNGNSSSFGIDDTSQTLIATGNLLRSTSGSVSGQHLKINVGGTDYVIELKNP